MALTQVHFNAPYYTALSGDIVGSKITGASIKGAKVYILDTKKWYMIQDDLTLIEANTEEVSIAGGGATFAIDQTTDGTTNGVSVKTSSGAGSTIGVTTDSALTTDVDGTISGRLRGLAKLIIDKITVKLDSGENHVGQMGGASVVSDASVAMTTAGLYAIGDFVGTNGTPIEFSVARIDAGSGIITGAVLVDKAVQSLPLEVWLFESTVTPPNDSAAWTIADADAVKCIGIIPMNTYYASALNSISIVTGLSITFKCAAASKKIYGAVVTRGAPTYASNDLVVRLRVLQD